MRKLFLTGIVLFLCLANVQEGQSQIINSLGIPAFSSVGGSSFDRINLGNLNTHFEIPIVNKSGRGLPFTFSLAYDGLIWSPVTVGSTTSWQLLIAGGWSTVGTDTTGLLKYTGPLSRTCTWNRQQWTYTYFKVSALVDQLGISHIINRELSNDTDVVCNPDKSFLSISFNDGSGMGGNISTDGASVTGTFNLLDGSSINSGTGVVQDRNGNSVNGGTDSLGTLTLSVSGVAPSNTTYTYPGPGGSASFTVKYAVRTVQTAFHSTCSTIQDVTLSNVNLISEIDLPDYSTNPNSRYLFTYEQTPGFPSNTTGRLASITLPTGGVVSYGYGEGSSINCSDGTPTTLTRTTTDGTTTYSRTNASGSWVTTATDPLNQVSTLTFATYTTAGIVKTDFYETKRIVKDSGGTVRATTVTCYNAVCPTSSTTTAPFSSVAVYSQFGSSGKAKEVKTTYNTNGQATQVDEYDFGSGGSTNPPTVGGLLRSTVITYSGAFPTEVDVKTGGGGIVGKTLYSYDQYAVTATSGTPMHTAGINFGNLTTVQQWISGTNYLTSHFHYFDTGNVSEYDDPNGAATTFAYGACGNSFPTTVTPPISSLATSMTWNCSGAVKTSTTDPNGAVSSVGYADAVYWRPTSTTDPLSNVTSITYPDLNTVQSAFNFNGTTSTSTQRTKVDSFGRPYLSESKQGQSSSNWDIVETFYDGLGRAVYQTLPYQGSIDATTTTSSPGVSTSLDVLSRPTSVIDSGGGSTSYTYSDNDTLVDVTAPTGESHKKRQMEINGLGQLTSVCEVTSGTGSGTCSQSLSQTGYWTTYSSNVLGNLLSVTQNAQAAAGSQQSRSFTFDGVGRLLSETNPENGTTSYTYDSDGTCVSTSAGDLVKKTDAQGDTICSFYDTLHRPTVVSFSGGYAASTPTRNFVYDSATVNSIAMTNVKGRLAEAYTGTSGSKITDIGFSYSLRGEGTDVYELTPHSSGYNHTSTSYWANGAPSQLGIPGVPPITYQVDGKGRTSTVSAASGTNPVTSCCGYTSAGLPTAITFGSGDSDGYSYDSNTNRPTQYQLNVGGLGTAYVKGVLTWNTNGSLASQAITDTINSSNSQTCNYTYDDLARLGQAYCGSGWKQDFSYDPFGNISKSVPVGAGGQSFQATYSSSTNRISSLPSFTPTYDSNGNLTNDSFHLYSWDAVGNMLTADSVTVTYDALDRAVEQGRSGVYTQVVYGPGGTKVALMSGTALSLAFVPLPAGAQAIYSSSGLQRIRHGDYLESARLSSTVTTPTTAYSDVSYAPFGEAYNQYGTADLSFTGQNQDTASGLYDFLYREESQPQGRWLSPDPAGLKVVDLTNPQSWNRYSYVLNSPTLFTDPLGLTNDCGGPCTPFSYQLGSCTVSVSYYTQDGYDMPQWNYACDFGGGRTLHMTLKQWDDVHGTGPCHGNFEDCQNQRKSANNGFTLGIRAPGQTFGNCMKQHAQDYSMAGMIDLTFGSNLKENGAVAFFAGNHINGVLFGSGGEAAMTGAHLMPAAATQGMGNTLAAGRYSSTIIAVNPGGGNAATSALGWNTNLAGKAALEGVEKVANMGMSATVRWGIDLGFSLAEAFGCAIPQ